MNVLVDRRPGARGASPAGATRRVNRAVAGPLRLLLGSRLHGRAAMAPLLARLGAGVVFVIFSIGKFTRHGPEAASFERYGLPFPDALTYVVGVLELGGGLLLILGLLTRLAALGLAVNLAVAIATAGRIEGGPIHLGLAPVLLATMLFLVWAGPGAASLDERLLGRAPAGRGRRRSGQAPPASVSSWGTGAVVIGEDLRHELSARGDPDLLEDGPRGRARGAASTCISSPR